MEELTLEEENALLRVECELLEEKNVGLKEEYTELKEKFIFLRNYLRASTTIFILSWLLHQYTQQPLWYRALVGC